MGIQNINELTDGPDFDVNHDDTDVPAALARDTQDGSGFDSEDELPPSDFEEVADDDDQV